MKVVSKLVLLSANHRTSWNSKHSQCIIFNLKDGGYFIMVIAYLYCYSNQFFHLKKKKKIAANVFIRVQFRLLETNAFLFCSQRLWFFGWKAHHMASPLYHNNYSNNVFMLRELTEKFYCEVMWTSSHFWQSSRSWYHTINLGSRRLYMVQKLEKKREFGTLLPTEFQKLHKIRKLEADFNIL